MMDRTQRAKYWRAYYAKNREHLQEKERMRIRNNPFPNRRKVGKHRRTVKGRYGAMKVASKRRSLDFSISFETFTDLVACGKCFFCQGQLPVVGYGVDRLDNRYGYVEGNCVSCCTNCNRLKGRIEWLGFIYPRTVELMRELMISKEPRCAFTLA